MAQQPLFGYSPEQIMQARQLALRERASTEASRVGGGWAPLYEQSRRLSMMGADALGRGLFPQAQDPALQKAQITQSIVNKYRGQDFNDPSVLSKMASEFSEAGQPELAMELGDRARKLKPRAESPYAKIDPSKYTPESLSVFDRTGNMSDLDPIEKTSGVKTNEETARIAGELGFGVYPTVDRYSQEQLKAINARRDDEARKRAEASATRLTIKGQEKILNIDEKDAETYQKQRDSSRKALSSLSRMETLLEKGVITGSAQEARTGFLRALDTLGVSTDKAKKVVGNTEQFDKEVRQLLLSIIKTLGYNPSNADVRFAMDSLPSLTNSAQGLQEIIKRFAKVNKDTLSESERALSYYRKNNGSFEGFTPNIDVWSPKQITPGDLSDAELQERIRAAKAKQQK